MNQSINHSEAFVRHHLTRLSGAVQQYHDKTAICNCHL